MLLIDFFDSVYKPSRLRGKSQNTERLYRLCITQFGRTLGRSPKLTDLTDSNVLKHLARRTSVAAATRNKELSELTAMWRLASQKKLLDTWPDIRDEHEPERNPIAWLPSEVAVLLQSIRRTQGSIGNVPAWLFWTTLVRLILDTGERISAIRDCQWHWIQGEWLRVPAEARKGKTRDRAYRLSTETLLLLDELRRLQPLGNVFEWPYCHSYLWSRFSSLVAIAGLPTGRKYGFHCLRKTVGSVVYAAGCDPQDTLDHSDRRTTQRYLDPRYSKDKQTCDFVAEMLEKTRISPRKRDAG